jgi:hypothetical protein
MARFACLLAGQFHFVPVDISYGPMTPAEINLVEVAKRYTAISIQVSKAYDAEQSKLNLDDVLSSDRLSSAEGTQESLAAIQQLATLTEKHKTAIEKVFLACATDLTQSLAALPENQRASYRDGLLKSLHGQLAAQSQFYQNRGRWIESAREICRLIESRREGAVFDGNSIVFREDADQEHFTALLERIESTDRIEEQHMQEMLVCFNNSAAVLGNTSQ